MIVALQVRAPTVWEGEVRDYKHEPGVCYCPLCSEERGEPDEAYWRELELAFADMPETPEMVSWAIHMDHILSDYSNCEPEVVRPKLIDLFRGASRQCNDLFEALAEMLDPAGKSTWKLELCRRRRGRPGRLSELDSIRLAVEYGARLEELKDQNRASPAKTARGELAERYKMTDEEIRAIIERRGGKRKRRPARERAVRK